ncbi:PREDICTED: elongation of very long chain fatty acids protein AAEL008004-like [Polistes dominula]|uniref:Elongation of very long chain fatty acids protein n=1 Tax=Polistes dominula TaxID=743375 RepID=A0ABM1IBD3_POLDO|nr:PREDICTED: elongation of very long chain fatty acids protein AAEL008004-like [Polistes dominula]
MKNRPPYSLSTFIRCYNIFQIISNSIVIYIFFDGGWFEDIFFYCVPMTYNTDPKSMKIATALWCTLLLKVIDLTESIIFLLRKKDRQLSVLHIYHHVSTVLLVWNGMRYYACGMTSVLPLVNCSVHVIMYTYYFLSSCGPKVQKLIKPYKSIITIIQIVQLILLILYIVRPLLFNCNIPKNPALVYLLNMVINLVLFLDFYQKTYKIPERKNK